MLFAFAFAPNTLTHFVIIMLSTSASNFKLHPCVTGASVTVPVVGGRLGLGAGQGVFLCEHRVVGGFGGGLNRRVVLTLQGQ